MKRRTMVKLVAPVVALSLVAAACGDDDDGEASGDSTTEQTAGGSTMEVVATDTPAATLRADLTGLLSEHVYLAALATGAALRGDDAGFQSFAAALNGPTDSNTADLVEAITSAYGTDVGKAFDGLWRSEAHIPAFVAYTQAVAAGDQAKADEAVADLTAYATTFGTTLNSVNENLPAAAVEEMVKMHVVSLKDVVDAQKAGDQTKVYASLRSAYAHMAEMADALAAATVKQFPDDFEGDPSSAGAGLRAGMTSLLREHVLLAASATGAALGGRMPQFEAAAAALNGPAGSNSADIVAAIGAAYGAEVGRAFDGLWRSEGHIPAFVAYTEAVAAGDQAKADEAVADLLAYAKTFGTTLNSVNENLPAAAVEEALASHATTLKAVVDAQKAGDAKQAASALRAAVHHMSDTAAVLASATAKKFPEKF